MAYVFPIVHCSVFLGEVTVMNAAAIVKFASLTALPPPLVALTRSRADVVAGPFTTHAYEPDVAVVLATDAAITDQLAPPSRLTSSATVLPAPRLCVHAIVCVEFTPQFGAAAGAVTAMLCGTTFTFAVLVAFALTV